MKKSMLQITMIIPLTLLLCFAFGCKQPTEEMAEEAGPVDVEADIAAVKEILNQYAVASNAGDFDLWISLWADDGVQMPPNAPVRIGKEQIREAMKPGFDQWTLDIAITSIEDAKVYGDLGLTRCNYTLDVTPKAGGETIHAMRDGKALTLLERQSDGSWKIVYDCFNSNMPPGSAELEEQNKALVKRIYETFSKGDLEAYKEMLAPEYVWYLPSRSTKPISREEIIEFGKMLHNAFPDITYSVEELIAEEDKVMSRFIMRGTHEGEYQGIPATGNKVEVSGVMITRIENGKAIEDKEELDALGLMMQLGMELKPKE